MIILVDIGNSRLKWASGLAGRFEHGPALDYRAADIGEVLRPLWQNLQVPRKVAIACVAQPGLAEKVADLARALWPGTEILIPRAAMAAFGVRNAYAAPETLGVDRWLALVAAHRYYPGRNCIVDCGTAITVDVVDQTGAHLGGLISPGLVLMKKSLAANTAGLEFATRQPNFGLCANTAAAIDSGTLAAALGLIETVLNSQNQPCRLLLCGGDAALLAGLLRKPQVIDTDLVFKGLRMLCDPGESE